MYVQMFANAFTFTSTGTYVHNPGMPDRHYTRLLPGSRLAALSVIRAELVLGLHTKLIARCVLRLRLVSLHNGRRAAGTVSQPESLSLTFPCRTSSALSEGIGCRESQYERTAEQRCCTCAESLHVVHLLSDVT